jgi:uncharacterized membrane protein
MDALNLLRAVLVGCALVAAGMLATRGMWVPATVLALGIAAHLALFAQQRAARRRAADHARAIDGPATV